MSRYKSRVTGRQITLACASMTPALMRVVRMANHIRNENETFSLVDILTELMQILEGLGSTVTAEQRVLLEGVAAALMEHSDGRGELQ